jgi:hypothetical protein
MKPLSLIVSLVYTATVTACPTNTSNGISIEDAAKKGLIKLLIKSKGGYTGDVINMKIKNNTAAPIALKIEAGRKLDSKNDKEQDILITQAQELIVYGYQEKNVGVSGMCCQAHNSCPREKSEYSVGTMADSALIKLARYIDKNKYYQNQTAQQAVWAVSDNESIGGIYGGDKKIVEEIRTYVSLITGRPIPPYNITYQQTGNSTIGHPFKIEGEMEYNLNTTGHVTIAIYNASGEMVQLLFKDIAHDKGPHKLYYTFRTKDLPSGTYYARATNEGRTENEVKIEF